MNDRTLPTKNTETAIGERESWAYPSLAQSGHVEIELPSLPGSPVPTERLHARDFGRHVAEAVERSVKGNPYPNSGPQQGPAEVLGHYIATARGSKLLDRGTLEYAGRLAKEFAAQKAEDQQKYFESMVRPYLLSLKPTGNGAAAKTVGNPFPNSKMPPART
jgi:hypothetical protein